MSEFVDATPRLLIAAWNLLCQDPRSEARGWCEDFEAVVVPVLRGELTSFTIGELDAHGKSMSLEEIDAGLGITPSPKQGET